MCGRFSLIDGSKTVISERFGAKHWTAEFETASGGGKPLYNAAPSFTLPVILDSYDGERSIGTYARWGFEPAWASKRGHPFANARLDTIQVRPTFREAFAHRHCLIPANSFFEWHREKGIKQPYCINVRDEHMFAFAGIWEPSPRSGGLPTFAILTTESNELMSRIHDRMPVIIPRDREELWLTTHEGELPFPAQYPSEKMQMYPVTTKVNKVSFNEPEAIERIPDPGLGI